MTAVTNLAGASTYVLQEAITDLVDEAYTNARKIVDTGIVGSNPMIDPSTETFIGQIRWWKPLNPQINVMSLTDATEGTKTTTAQDMLTYVKTARSHGAQKVNMQTIVTQQDGLLKVARDFVETQTQDMHNAMMAVLRGVALSELLVGAGTAGGGAGLGGQTFDNDPTSALHGFYVDLGASKLVTDATSSNQGAARAEGFLQAIGKAYKDYELPYYYLVTSPEVMASLRSANLVDSDRAVEGNVEFNTIFQGKFRLILTRANQGFSSAERTKINTGGGVDITGTKLSFIIAPGSLAFASLEIPDPGAVEIERKAGVYMGGGTTDIWYRWGYVLHPAGYDWRGASNAFPSDASYGYAIEGSDPKALTSVSSATLASTTGTWKRKTQSVLSLGILPVLHS